MAKRVALFAGSFSCRHNPSICATSLHHCGPLAASVTIYDPSRSQRKAISQPSYRSASAAQSSVYNWPSGHETPTFKSSKRDFYYQIWIWKEHKAIGRVRPPVCLFPLCPLTFDLDFLHVCGSWLYFASDFYGSIIWNLSHNSIDDICVAWRKGLRRILSLPYNTHSRLISPVCDFLPVREELICRCASFIMKCLNSCNSVVHSVSLMISMVFIIIIYYYLLNTHSVQHMGTNTQWTMGPQQTSIDSCCCCATCVNFRPTVTRSNTLMNCSSLLM